MKKGILIVVSAFVALPLRRQEQKIWSPSKTKAGTVIADSNRAVLPITHERLGSLMNNVRTNLKAEKALQSLTAWSVQAQGQSALTLRTTGEPAPTWRIEIAQNTLKISSTSSAAALPLMCQHRPIVPSSRLDRLSVAALS